MSTQSLLAVALCAGFPIWDIWEARRLKQAAFGTKWRAYVRYIAGLWLFALWAMAAVPLTQLLAWPGGVTADASPAADTAIAGVGIGLILALLIGLLLPVALLVHPPMRKRILAQFHSTAYLLPQTNIEMAMFSLVALSAGVCEELLYRGFLIRCLHEHFAFEGPSAETMLLASAVLSSVLFGAAHAGFGWKGIVQTALIGFALSVLFFVTGSLLLPIVLHILIDLRALIFAKAYRTATATAGDAEDTGTKSGARANLQQSGK
jgi:uncharacterized protein